MRGQEVYAEFLAFQDCGQSVGAIIQTDQVERRLERQRCNRVHCYSVALGSTGTSCDYRDARYKVSGECPQVRARQKLRLPRHLHVFALQIFWAIRRCERFN
jgi:hypothetical protein